MNKQASLPPLVAMSTLQLEVVFFLLSVLELRFRGKF